MLQVKKSFATLLLACCLCSAFNGTAQNADPAQASKAMTDKMKTELSLNEEQYTKVSAINLDFTQAAAELRHEDGGRAGKLAGLRELRQKREASLKGVLDEEQFRKFKDQQKENRNNLRSRRAAGRE
jgi:hypothetical protein